MTKDNKPAGPDSAAWDAICARCGRCCYEKLDYEGRIYYTNTPCEHLDTELNLCRIYARRSELHPECARLTPELLTAGILPEDCPYVSEISDYPAPKMDSD